MNEPEYILNPGVRVRTNQILSGTGGFMVGEKHMKARVSDTLGVIKGIVGGHGGDVYWVIHLNSDVVAAYGFQEFELDPPKPPCQDCQGWMINIEASNAAKKPVACSACNGTGEKPAPSVWERLAE